MLKARKLYGASAEADPNYARAWAGLSWSHWWEAIMGGWTMSRDEALQEAINFAEHAVEVDRSPKTSKYRGRLVAALVAAGHGIGVGHWGRTRVLY